MMMVVGDLALSGVSLVLQCFGREPPDLLLALQSVYFAAAASTFIAHVYLARSGTSNFTVWVWQARVALNALTMSATLVVTAMMLVLCEVAPNRVLAALIPGADVGVPVVQQPGLDPAAVAAAYEQIGDIRLAGFAGVLYSTVSMRVASCARTETHVMLPA